MHLWLITIIDILISILTLLFGMGIYNLIACFTVTIPLTDQFIKDGILQPSIKKQLVFVQISSQFIGFIIFNGILIVAAFMVKPSGLIIYGIIALLKIFWLKPTKDRYSISDYSIRKYAHEHSICMDMDRFNVIYHYVYDTKDKSVL